MTDTFSKTVAIKAVDEEERTATGAVLVPNEVDRQREFIRPEGIERMFADDPEDGVMHSAFSDGAAELVRNEVVDDEIELNGETYPPGTWIATRKYNDDALWQLVADGVLEGFSIGGEISEERQYAAGEVPEMVRFPEPVDEGGAVELVDGQVNEISDVDIPAVPRATYRELSKLGKSITEEVDGREEFVELMQERGHSREDASRLYRYLQRNKTADEPAESGADVDKTDDMSDSDPTDEDEQSAKEAAKNSDFDSDGADIGSVDDETLGARLKSLLGFGGGTDDPDSGEDAGVDKAGRTLSQTNRRAVMASIDAQLDMLDDAGVDHGMQRFTDRDEFAFDLASYEGKGNDEMDKNAPEGDTSDETMTDENDDTEKSDSPPEWAKSLIDDVEQIDKRVSEMEDDEDAEKSLDDAPEWAQDLAEKVDGLDDRVDKVSKATATTQQTGGSETTGDDGDELSKTEKQKRELFFGGN